jgi:hypothetical protein
MTIKRIRFRRGTAASWTSDNPTLATPEPGYETDTKQLKIGDGSTPWNDLGYFPYYRITEPSDSSVKVGGMVLWFDPTNGAAKLKIKAKTLNGTVVVGELPLAPPA